ncbi:acetyl-CoA carboxylase carboxyltransferase subunit alpha [Sulfurihydrogenibium azorense]|jgi:acetyl-CoA carboxylase carboxyl transferase subunit alpha|uniref:Acetyl-coenzyme A carboxylase carboxyl transferase subunit alpha n=1 Tax=Sulfurihydrogenibium azorense (strain DSM 15241 / OCM 825 / Az-Fu1) TaxID=204536 RepID=C1DT58_SULAA|nr:acetyl-CoA carboxylase carboxyltransferase subunit alpha [Sulfurihydrogenibium azorense]ACN98747.1 acetyl-CoA carboxylase, carboxyl transferase, alpha subunit [Sulfurihydrogenibium azorense Az-Fu1]MDM7273403.1 acetyl-CoA carboxylase carboxyltransferase subunit alpha [Sulfurihydrogenibium azorense]
MDLDRELQNLSDQIEVLRERIKNGEHHLIDELVKLRKTFKKLSEKKMQSLTAWDRVQLARHPKRPHTIDYINNIFTDFIELHGDRRFGDDKAIVAGFANFEGIPVCVIGHEKGKDTKEKIERNFGMPHPEGYRKAIRVMKLAEKFKRPVFTFIDTPGAYPGIGAEERGQSQAIAESLMVMGSLRTPIIATVIGEGGSGGALALGVADKILMLENSIYSVISPEGCAAILFKSAESAPIAAESLKITAKDLLELGVIDCIVREPRGGAHLQPKKMYRLLKWSLRNALKQVENIDLDKLVELRHKKFYSMGRFAEK